MGRKTSFYIFFFLNLEQLLSPLENIYKQIIFSSAFPPPPRQRLKGCILCLSLWCEIAYGCPRDASPTEFQRHGREGEQCQLLWLLSIGSTPSNLCLGGG